MEQTHIPPPPYKLISYNTHLYTRYFQYMCVYVLRDRYCDAIRVMFDVNLKLECFNKRCPKWGSGMKLARYKITFDPSDYCCGKTNRKTKDLFLFFLFSSDDCVYILAIQVVNLAPSLGFFFFFFFL